MQTARCPNVSSREKVVLAHPKMNPTWAPPRPSQDVNETGSMNLCQFEGRPALPPKVAFIQPPKNGSKTARKIQGGGYDNMRARALGDWGLKLNHPLVAKSE